MYGPGRPVRVDLIKSQHTHFCGENKWIELWEKKKKLIMYNTYMNAWYKHLLETHTNENGEQIKYCVQFENFVLKISKIHLMVSFRKV